MALIHEVGVASTVVIARAKDEMDAVVQSAVPNLPPLTPHAPTLMQQLNAVSGVVAMAPRPFPHKPLP